MSLLVKKFDILIYLEDLRKNKKIIQIFLNGIKLLNNISSIDDIYSFLKNEKQVKI